MAIINSVQTALAAKLDMQGIYNIVGDKIREIFNVPNVVIFALDRQSNHMLIPYGADEIYSFDISKIKDKRFFKYFDETKQSLLINQNVKTEAPKYGIYSFDDPVLYNPEATSTTTYSDGSLLFVPLVVGNEVKGIISLQNLERENAFSLSDVRLLTTLANSMSVALESARLFDETQRLLKETEQRAAELSIINGVQAGLAQNLDIQAIYEIVGEKIQEIFDAQTVLLIGYDREYTSIISHYMIEKSERFYPNQRPMNELHRSLISNRKTLLFNENADEELTKLGATIIPGTEIVRSAIFVPLTASNRVFGMISIQNVDREHAYHNSDVRLLETLASSMSVALENARLFDETQRLLKETEERNAELAVITSVQQGLASKLEFQSIIDLVGDKVTEIFNAQATLISLYNSDTNEIDHRYLIERRERIRFDRAVPIDRFRQRVVETRQPWLINQDYLKIATDLGEEPVLEGEEPKSLLFVPMIVGDEVTGIISLQNLDVENAFSDSDVRLLSTIANSMSIALENARLFNAEQQRATELAAISTVSQALVAETELDSMIQLIGGQMREIFEADIVYVALLDPQTNLIHFPYQIGETFDTLTLGEGLTSRIIRTGEPLLINKDIKERRAQLGTTLVGRESLSYLGVPIKSGKETIGVLSVQSTT